MDRPIRYQHSRFLGDKRRQVVYDLDELEDRAVLDELVASEQVATFGPDTLVEARNRGYRLPKDLSPAMAVATVDVGGLRLAAHVARPTGVPRTGLPGVVLVPGYPSGPDRGASAPATHPSLADRIAQEMGWVALALNPRGTGGSQGNFSLDGWFEDVLAAAEHLSRNERANGVWLAGFGTGGAISICAGARDLRVRGVAALGAPADFDDWARHPKRLIEHSRLVGIIRDADFPPSIDEWATGLRELRAAEHAGELAPRALLLVHGSEDQLVPEADARTIADAHGTADLRVIRGAGHNLRQDPRAMAVLLGWLDRQRRRVPF